MIASQKQPVSIACRRANGIELETAQAGPVDGPLVILLHGFPDLWQTWNYQIDPLVAAGFRVMLPNQRGYGMSSKPLGIGSYDIDSLAQDIVALAESEGRANFSLIGHDWGGIIAWWLAANYTSHIEKLVILNAPNPSVFRRYALRRPSQLLRSWYVGFFQLPWLPETVLGTNNFAMLFRAMQASSQPGLLDESYRKELLSGWSNEGSLTAMINYYRAFVRRKTDSLPVRIKTPTLIIHSRSDPTLEVGLAEESAKLCDKHQLVVFEGRHWIHREDPIKVNSELLKFLV